METKYFIMHFDRLDNSILPMDMLEKVYSTMSTPDRHPVVAQDLTFDEALAVNKIFESLKENKHDPK